MFSTEITKMVSPAAVRKMRTTPNPDPRWTSWTRFYR
jgi:hypothetical protein